MIKRIDHINICVSDLEEATAFFTDLLEFKVLKEGLLEGDWIDQVVSLKGVRAKYVQLLIPGSETSLELIKYYHPQGGTDPNLDLANQVGFRHMAFEVSDIEGIYNRLMDAGVKVHSEIQVYNVTKKLFYFTGPDNIILECAQYG